MRAAVITARGGAPAITAVPEPAAVPGTHKIRVQHAGLQPTDIMRSAGTYKTPALPYIVGGEGVGQLENGARVYFGHSIATSGAVAEWTIVPDEEVWPLPDGIDDAQAIALAIAGTGALIPLQQCAIRPGETVLVLGATGPLGQVAVQAARALGAGRVVAAARSRDRLERLLARGIVDEVVQLGTRDDAAALKTSGGSRGFDVVLDAIYGPPFIAALRATAFDARLVTVGAAAGTEVTLGVWDMVRRTHFGGATGYRPAAERRAAWETMLGWHREGRMTVDIVAFKLADIRAAWQAQLGSPGGKIVIRVEA